MKVIEFIKEHGIEKLKQDLSIIVKEYPEEGLLVLNYDQINSPKTDPIVMECRGLILDVKFNVVSRSFDRFFNFGEAPEHTAFDFDDVSIFEKVDGSLIKIYNHKGVWHIATRGTAFAESGCNGFDSFRTLVLRAIPNHELELETEENFQTESNFWLDPAWTYIFEFTSVENRVVTQYTGYNLTYLAARHNETGTYGDEYEKSAASMAFDCAEAKSYKFDTIEHCLEMVKNLPNLEEGYVVYRSDGKPVCKIKSPAYVAAHHIRSNDGLTPKNISKLVVTNETDEYLSYFEDDKELIIPYLEAWNGLRVEIDKQFTSVKDIEEQKKFALAVSHMKYKHVLFSARKLNISTEEVISGMDDDMKLRLLMDNYER